MKRQTIHAMAIVAAGAVIGGGILYSGRCDAECQAQRSVEAIVVPKNTIKSVPPVAFADLRGAVSNAVLIDVRTPEEFSEGHIEGAVNIDFRASDFGDRMASLPKDVPYLIYCRSGNRSGQALSLMEGLGFQEVYDMAGGINAWTEEGRSIVR